MTATATPGSVEPAEPLATAKRGAPAAPQAGASKGKVIHVIESLGRGGAEAALVAGLPALRRLGWDLSVVALRPPADLAGDLRARGIPVAFGVEQLPRQLASARGAPGILHTHLFFANMVGRAAAAVARVPLVTTLHSPDYGTEGGGRFGLRRVLDRALLVVKRPTYLSVSEAVREDYVESLGIVSTVYPNPLDPFWLEPAPSRAEARARLGVGDGPLVFACGRLHRQKGFDLLGRVASRFEGTRFVVAGSGPAEAVLRASGPLELVGSLTRERVRDWVVASDVVAVPSRWESFGIFALEAMALGAAIVGSDVPGLRDTLAGGARLVTPDHEDALADALRALMGDRDERVALGRAAAARARQFTADVWASRHDQLYTGLLPR